MLLIIPNHHMDNTYEKIVADYLMCIFMVSIEHKHNNIYTNK